jgi:uncharacterized membrane protein
VAPWDPAGWTAATWVWYSLGGLYLLGFAVFLPLVWRAQKRVRAGVPGAVARHDRLVRGFPNGFYAKMVGIRPLGPKKGKGA